MQFSNEMDIQKKQNEVQRKKFTDDELREMHPYMDKYIESQKLAKWHAFGAFLLSTTGFGLTSNLLEKKKLLPYHKKHIIWTALVFGTCVGYMMMYQGSKYNLLNWRIVEGKYSELDAVLNNLDNQKMPEKKELEDD